MRAMPRLEGRENFLYRELADLIAAAIAAGTLKVGDRLPSVRVLCGQYRVSVATAVQAYRHLENRRLIEARPKSGFFVAGQRPALAEPRVSRPPASPRFVSTPSLFHEYVAALDLKDAVHLGAVLPHPDLYPGERLSRLIASHARRSPEALARYALSRGSEALRQTIARRCLEAGVHIGADDILVTDGCLEALSLCLRAAARPGDVIALESPTHFLFLHAIESLGMKVLEIPTHPRTGISLDAFDLATQKRGAVKAAILMPTHSSPLGSVMPDESKARLVELCAERGVALIENDALGDLCFGTTRPLPAKAWDRHGNVLLCSSFTKTLAPGLRVGWVAPGRFAREVELIKLASTMFTPLLPQAAIAEFVANGGYDHHLRRLRSALAERSMRVTEAIAARFPSGCRVTRPAGGYNLWIELPPAINAVALFRQAVNEGVVVPPGPLFTTTGKFRSCIRLTNSEPWSSRTEAAIATIGRLAHRLAA